MSHKFKKAIAILSVFLLIAAITFTIVINKLKKTGEVTQEEYKQEMLK